MENFTPLSGLIGGLFIGLGAAVLLLCNGRIAGISGVLGGLFAARPDDRGWRIVFLLGLIIGPVLLAVLSGSFPTVNPVGSNGLLIVGGVLVGFGTRLGSGCTSGHGVCGLARGSKRSLVATAVFFVTALLTALIATLMGWHG